MERALGVTLRAKETPTCRKVCFTFSLLDVKFASFAEFSSSLMRDNLSGSPKIPEFSTKSRIRRACQHCSQGNEIG